MSEDFLPATAAPRRFAQALGLEKDGRIRLRPLLTWLPALSSLALLFGVLGFALHVRLGLGHWPKPMWEKYRTVASDIHGAGVVWFGLFTVYGAPLLWLVMLCFKPLRISWPIHFRQALAYGLGWLLLFIYVKWDPHRFVAWYAD